MSVARTARRRRKMYSIGAYDQIFGKRAPHYKKRDIETSKQREAAFRERVKKLAARGGGKKK